MHASYNLYNLQAPFKNYLVAENVSPATMHNYLSDFRHFAGWYSLVTQSAKPNTDETSESELSLLPSILSKQTFYEYRAYLLDNHLPIKTVNRRLSTLRKLSSFCISQGWLKQNAAKQMANIEKDRIQSTEFEAFLSEHEIDAQTREHMIKDLEALGITNLNP